MDDPPETAPGDDASGRLVISGSVVATVVEEVLVIVTWIVLGFVAGAVVALLVGAVVLGRLLFADDEDLEPEAGSEAPGTEQW